MTKQKEYTFNKKIKNNITNPEIKSLDKYFIWHIQGGLGKHVAATALCQSIKETYPDRKLIMVVGYPEVFTNNPYVDRVYNLTQTPYFYEDYIENKDIIICRHEPYHQTGHINKTKHLIENWCDLLGIKYNNQLPKIYINFVQKKLTGIWQREKPTVVIQTNGGPMYNQKYNYSWTRDIPQDIAQTIVNKFKDQYHIFQITTPNSYIIEGVERIDQELSNFELFAILIHAEKRILIDSSLQHVAAAFKLPSTVLWVGTSPILFGYEIHNNIVAKLPKKVNQLIGSYLFDFQFENNLHECPYIELTDIFDVNIMDNI
jgi:ADP-heptose:LPS heptosyltransferase